MKKFVLYSVFSACIFFLIQTSCIGKGVKPSELRPQEPAKVITPAAEHQKQDTLIPTTGEKPPTTTQPDSGETKSGKVLPSGQLPTEAPKEIKQPEPKQPLPVEPKKEQVIPPKAPQKPAGGSVSFNFDDADVFSVIQTIFGDVLKVNYIVDPNVKGKVNFRSVAPVAKEDVLPLMQVILRLNGIGIVEESGLYRIVPIGDIPKEPAPIGIGRESEKVQIIGKALLQVVPIQYIKSSEMVRVITPFLSKNAVIVDVPAGNYIIIVDTDANVKRLLQLVEVFDSEQLKQVIPKVFVYAVQNSKAKDVASLLQQIFLGAKPTTPVKPSAAARTPVPPAGQTTPQPQISAGYEGGEALVSEITKIFPDEVTNSIIILATSEDYALIAETIKKIDIVPRQVVIEGLIARVDLTDNLSFGISWSFKNYVDIGLRPFTNDVKLKGDINVNAAGLVTIPTKGFTFVGTDPKGIVRAVLTALAEESKAKVLAAPHILVSDNKEARIQVGRQIPIATSTTSTPIVGGTAVTTTSTSTIQYKDIGIILKVKPQVNDSGLISLEITQEISSLGETVKVGGLDEISINKTEATTNLVAKDGDTIIIGGLIQEDVSKSKDGIPFISKIPIIGNLFGNTTDKTTRTELIILLTPHVMKNLQEAGDVTSDYLDRYKASTKDKDINKFIKERKGQGADDKGSKDSKQDAP